MSTINSEPAATYRPDIVITMDDRRPVSAETEQAVVDWAIDIVEQRMRKPVAYIASPEAARNLARLKLREREREVFAVMWLDNRHGMVVFDELFYGTIDGAQVTPREVVKAGLACNAAAAILVHNHPSGVSIPSEADKTITERLVSALRLIDVRVLDHLIVGADVYSFAEHDLL